MKKITLLIITLFSLSLLPFSANAGHYVVRCYKPCYKCKRVCNRYWVRDRHYHRHYHRHWRR